MFPISIKNMNTNHLHIYKVCLQLFCHALGSVGALWREQQGSD